MFDPPLLKLRIQHRMMPKADEHRMIVEVIKDGEVIGQLPATAVRSEQTATGMSKVSIDLINWKADIETHD